MVMVKSTLVSMGLFTLLLGYAFYALVRVDDIPHLYYLGTLENWQHNAWTFAYRSLPSFIHTFAFACLTACFLDLKTRTVILNATFWLILNFVYELFSETPLAEQSGLLFYGDHGDVIAALLGAVTFTFTTRLLQHIRSLSFTNTTGEMS